MTGRKAAMRNKSSPTKSSVTVDDTEPPSKRRKICAVEDPNEPPYDEETVEALESEHANAPGDATEHLFRTTNINRDDLV